MCRDCARCGQILVNSIVHLSLSGHKEAFTLAVEDTKKWSVSYHTCNSEHGIHKTLKYILTKRPSQDGELLPRPLPSFGNWTFQQLFCFVNDFVMAIYKTAECKNKLVKEMSNLVRISQDPNVGCKD